jgi:hypothetical protein
VPMFLRDGQVVDVNFAASLFEFLELIGRQATDYFVAVERDRADVKIRLPTIDRGRESPADGRNRPRDPRATYSPMPEPASPPLLGLGLMLSLLKNRR